jgi:hypothetical protein
LWSQGELQIFAQLAAPVHHAVTKKERSLIRPKQTLPMAVLQDWLLAEPALAIVLRDNLHRECAYDCYHIGFHLLAKPTGGIRKPTSPPTTLEKNVRDLEEK